MFLGHRPVFVLLQHQNHCHNTVSSQQLVYKAQSGPQTSPHHPPSPNVQQHDAPRFSAEVHCTDLPQYVQQQREHNLQRIGDTTAPAQHPANHAVHPADRAPQTLHTLNLLLPLAAAAAVSAHRPSYEGAGSNNSLLARFPCPSPPAPTAVCRLLLPVPHGQGCVVYNPMQPV
jgi:hypothetical protein